MSEQVLIKVVGLWFTLSVGSLVAATVNPSQSPAENTKLAPASSSFDTVYREPREYNAHEAASGNGYTYRPYDRPQTSRCISCLYAAMGGNQDTRDRPGYPSQHGIGMTGYGMSGGGSGGGGSGGGGSGYGAQRENDDRNWYYSADERNRYSQYENRQYQPQHQPQNRYDYRQSAGGYDRNDYRQNYQQDYRGNGYDNRDPAYYSSMRGGNRGYGNRENSYESYYDDRMSNRGYSGSAGGYGQQNYMRPNYQSSGGYDQDRYYGQGRPYERPERPERPEYYERPSQGGYRGGSSSFSYGYDDLTFRPWDQTYRGVSGFDSMGHGHYFASYPNSHNNPAQPLLPQNSPHQQAPPRPFQQPSGHHESSSGHSQHHQQQHQQQPHHSYDSDSLSHGNTGSGNSGKGSYDNNWHYINSNDRNSLHGSNGAHGHQQGYGHQSQDKDTQQSSAYGERPGQRPLSTSYLHERDTPTVISGDMAADANHTKQMKTTNSNDLDRSNADTTDKPGNNDTINNPIDETTNSVSSSTGASDQ